MQTQAGLNPIEQKLLEQSQGVNSTQSQADTGQQFDPSVVALMHGIKSNEGANGNYNSIGDKGTAAGIGQWSNEINGIPQPLQSGQIPANFQGEAKQYGLNPSDFSPTNQNKVMYATLEADKKSGLTPEQSLSKWNSGDPNKFLNAATSTGTGPVGAYDVSSYVKNGMTAAQKYVQQNKGQQQNNPSSTANTTPVQQQPKSLGDELGSAAAGITNFIAPVLPDIVHDIKGDSTKTGLQQLGDLGSTGLSALALVPGLEPEAIAGKLGLAGEEGLSLAGKIAANSALGAGFGATNAIGQGDTNLGQIGQSAATGGILGGGLGLAGEAVGGALDKLGSKTPASRLSEQAGGTKALQNALRDNTKAATATSGATDPITTFEQRGYTPQLKVQDSKVNVDAITNPDRTGSLDTDLENESANASELVKNMQGGVPTQQFKNDVMQEVSKNPDIVNAGNVSKAQAEVERKFTDLQNSYGDVLPWKAVDGIRSAANKDYEVGTRDISRSVGDTARKYLYDGGEVSEGLLPSVSLNQGGSNVALKSAMQNEGELIRARNFAEKLRGSTVKGGKIGKYFWDTIGAGIGTAVGSAGGPVGAGLGGLVGGFTADQGRKYLEEGYFNPTLGRTTKNLLKNGITKGTAKAANYGLLNSVGR